MGVGVGIVLAIPKFRHKVMPTVKTTMHNLWTVFTSPRKIAYIFGGSLLTQLMYALILGCCLQAYGSHLSLAELLFVNTFVSLFGGLIPVPADLRLLLDQLDDQARLPVTVSAVPRSGSDARDGAQRCCSRTPVGSRHPG